MCEEVAMSLQSLEPGAGRGKAMFEFGRDLEIFAGHFPGAPIVPAVYLLEAARIGAERLTGCRWDIAAVDRARFVRPVAPEQPVGLELRTESSASELTCDVAVADDAGPIAKLQLRLTAAE